MTETSTITKCRAGTLLCRVDEFGPMHIVVGDGNMEDYNLDFVETEMKKGATEEEKELLALLRSMTAEQRYDLWEEYF